MHPTVVDDPSDERLADYRRLNDQRYRRHLEGDAFLLTWCLAVGTMEHYHSGQTTMLLQIIAWPAIAISTLLLALLTCVAASTAIARLRTGS
jgi:hypothetical protein